MRMALALVAALAVLTACSKSGQPPAPPVPAPETPPPQSAAPAAPAQTPSPQAPAGDPASGPATAPAGAQRYVLVAESSKVSYIATELLAGQTVRNQAIGSTAAITGDLVLDAHGRVQPATFTVDLRTLASDKGMRDNYLRGTGLESNRHPMATFSVTGVEGEPTFQEGAAETFGLVGQMTIRDQERSVTWSVNSTVQDGVIRWAAALDTQLTDWGINPPVLLTRSVAEVDNALRLEADLVFKPAD